MKFRAEIVDLLPGTSDSVLIPDQGQGTRVLPNVLDVLLQPRFWLKGDKKRPFQEYRRKQHARANKWIREL